MQRKVMSDDIREKLLKHMNEMFMNIERSILDNQYEPSEHGAGFATQDFAIEEVYDDLKGLCEFVLQLYGHDVRFDKPSLKDILKTVTLDNYSDIFYSEFFEELEEFSDADADPKHIYVYKYFKHKDTGKVIEVFIDMSRNGEVDLDIETNIVIKKEKLNYVYERTGE